MIPFLLLQVGTVPAASPLDRRYQACLSLATSDPKAAEAEAERFRVAGGGARARQCLAMALVGEARWSDAAAAFEAAASDADAAKDPLAARYRAQAGNAWLAAGDPVKARAALTVALAGQLTDFERGEALLDRARAAVANGDQAAARTDLDAALIAVPKDPLAWLLSATLARRMNDLPRAADDIQQALRLSPDDASVQFEAGVIAAASRDFIGARTAWQKAAKIAPAGTPIGDKARDALTALAPVFVTAPGAPTGPAPAPAPPPPAPPPAKPAGR